MPRLCLADEIWEITQDGARLVIVAAGKQSVRKFVSPDHAKVQHDKLLAEKLAAGWAPTAAAAPEPADDGDEPREPALEAAIIADPYDAQAYSVYGDWYQSRQHPRGELIALQLAEEDNDAEKLRAAAEKHLARHRGVLLGELAELDTDGESAFGWRFGFIHRLALAGESSLDELGELLFETLHHPSGRFLAEVSARLRDTQALDEILAQLADVPTLRELSIVTSGSLGDTAPLAELRKLKKLVVKGHARDDESDDEPANLGGVARVAPTVEWLMLRVMSSGDAWNGLAPLFERADLALKHLGMRSPTLVDRAVCALADGPLAAGLETLDIALTDPDEAVRVLVAKRDRFAALRVLKLSAGRVVPKALAALRAAIPKVIDVRIDPDDEFMQDEGDLYDEVRE